MKWLTRYAKLDVPRLVRSRVVDSRKDARVFPNLRIFGFLSITVSSECDTSSPVLTIDVKFTLIKYF